MSNPVGSSISDLWYRHFNASSPKPEVNQEEFDDVKNDLRQVKNALYCQNMCVEKLLKELERLKALVEDRTSDE